jgi:hypothetical protein
MGIIGGIAYSPRNFGDDIIHHYPEQLKDNPQPLHPHMDTIASKDLKISLHSLYMYDHV